ncbi:hypothetical protein Tco_1440733 [Tanacetum coccineum]
MTSTHQQSFANVGSETRPPMLERGSYVPWSSRFMRYIDRKKDTRTFLKHSIEVDLYEFKKIPATATTAATTKTEDDLAGDNLKQYEADIDAMNLILLSIPNHIYNSVDSCENAKDMWNKVKRLMQGTELSQYARDYLKPRVQDLNYFLEQMLLAKKDEAEIILTNEQNDFLLVDASEVEEFEDLNVTVYMMAQIQQTWDDFDHGPIYNSGLISEVSNPSMSFIIPLYSKINHEQMYHELPEIIKPTIGNYQINSDIIFYDPKIEVNDEKVEQDKNSYDRRDFAMELFVKIVQKEAEKQQIISREGKHAQLAAMADIFSAWSPGIPFPRLREEKMEVGERSILRLQPRHTIQIMRTSVSWWGVYTNDAMAVFADLQACVVVSAKMFGLCYILRS